VIDLRGKNVGGKRCTSVFLKEFLGERRGEGGGKGKKFEGVIFRGKVKEPIWNGGKKSF